MAFSPFGTSQMQGVPGQLGGFGAQGAPDPFGLGAASNRLGMDPGMQMGGMNPMFMQQQQQLNQLMMMFMMLLMELMMGGQQGGAAGSSDSSAASGVDAASGSSSAGSSGGTSSAGSAAPSGAVDGPAVPTGPGTEKVANFINKAKSHQGAPYVFGAAGPSAFDCSGLVAASLKEAGVGGPRLTADGYKQRFKDSAVSKENLKPGDLVFFYSPNTRGIKPGHATHIEIYLGNGMTMGTDNPKEGAKIEPINWNSFIGGARVPQLYQ